MPPENLEKPAIALPSLMKIKPYVPGKSKIAGVERPIKLSSNENPFGASPAAVAAITAAAARAHRYPDGSCRELRAALGAHHGIDPERIVCGAGSDELFLLLAQAYAGPGHEIIYSQYGFLMFPIAALRVGAAPVVAPEKAYKTDVEAIAALVNERTRIIFIANPNNPTGSYVTKQEMRRLLDRIPGNVLVVVDAAYGEYVTAEDYSSGLGLVEEYPNVVMTRTFSKIFGLGGVRLGWSYSSPEIADALNRMRGPFNVSSLAQEVGIAALKDAAFVERSKAHNTEWCRIVSDALRDMGLKVFPSQANFVLAEFPSAAGKDAAAADAFLQKKGIIARNASSYGLPQCLRFTIGLAEENEALLSALKEFYGGEN